MNSTIVSLAVRAEPIQQRSAARITSLLDAAADLIDHRGIDGLTTSDVAARSGSSVGVVYRYFPNVQSLLRALGARNLERFMARMASARTAEPAAWLSALDTSIDAYVDLARSEPGFRALRFGDIIDHRFVDPGASNKSTMARMFEDLFVTKYHAERSPELAFDLEVLVEISDALLQRAFAYDASGDERFIARLRLLIREFMARHEAAVRSQ